jgi:hypothetical protein
MHGMNLPNKIFEQNFPEISTLGKTLLIAVGD